MNPFLHGWPFQTFRIQFTIFPLQAVWPFKGSFACPLAQLGCSLIVQCVIRQVSKWENIGISDCLVAGDAKLGIMVKHVGGFQGIHCFVMTCK